ncbi:MAG: amino acid adenylation domain-containing protein, partial [bacterium]|nr:amino acid adenylation domain-containing protein [bacterium]
MSGTRRTGTKTVPSSFAQERVWFSDRLVPDSALYNIPLVLRLQGRLDPGALARALGEIVRRHEVLRTSFETVEDVPVQVIRPELGLPLPVVDLTGLPDGPRRAAAHRLALAEARRSFDLTRCPLLRTTLVRLAGTSDRADTPERAEHALLFTVHHIVFDGWSVGVFLHELTALYQAFSAGGPSRLPELRVQYADYAVWQRQRLSKGAPGEELESQLKYWREQLAGSPVLELPTDRPRPAVQKFRGALHCFQLPAELNRQLAKLSRRRKSTLFMTLMAAFQALLGRYTGQVDLAVGTAIANRQPTEIQGLLGLFVNTLVLRGDLSGSPTFYQLLTRLHRVALQAYAHQDLPFEKLVEELKPERDLGHNPLVQVFLTLQYASMEARELAPGLGLSFEYPSTGRAKFDLSLSLEEDDGELRCELIYSTDLFDATTIHRLVGHFRRLLEAVVADAGQRLWELPLLTGAEGQQLLVEWNDTRRRSGHERRGREQPTLHHLFERQVARTPEAVAAVVPPEGDKWRVPPEGDKWRVPPEGDKWRVPPEGDKRGVAGRHLTYRELNRRANRLAHYLRALGVKPEALVGICSERSLEMVTGIFGILKSGGAYLPLDPDYPSQRLAFMLEDAGARVLLTRKRLLELLPEHRARVVCLDADQEDVAVHSPVNPRPAATAANLAYLIYTSGSTGRAKGVAIEHRSGVSLLEWVREVFAPEELAGVLGATSICFDLSIFELFAPLARGGKVIVAESALELPRLAVAEAVTLVNTVPSAMRELARLADLPRSVRTVNLAGETLQRELVDEVYRHPGVERVFNLYGPSEDTTYSTWAQLERGSAGPPSIGRPVADTRAYLLDRHQRPVPMGVPGELFLGGAGLARGYLDRPQLTAEVFVPDPFGGKWGERLYRTGDLVRALPNGELAFLGRLDHQVKVRGFRVELGEIETELVRHPGVREAVVLVREDPGPARLVAYAVAEREDVTAPELREFLHRTLPGYMVPSLVVVLEAMPLGPTGKVDRRALPAPEATGGGPERDNAAPCTPTEEMMADLWGRILGTRRIGVRDNFFELGGHSLLATRLLSRLRELFGVELDLRSVFQHPTLAGLAERTDRARRAGRGLVAPPIRPAARGKERSREGVPLSFAQQRLWFLAQLTPDLAIYNIPLALRLRGRLDPTALEGGLREIVHRHEVLRTRFETVEGKPVQVVRELAVRALPVVELTGLDEARRRTEAHRLALAAARRPFDLAQGPPLRAALLRLADTPEGEESLLLVTVHHIAFDGWSIGVFLDELAALYQAFSARLPSPLPELAVQYADFSEWQRHWLAGEVLETQLAYWREQLAGLPVLELPLDRPRPAVQSFRGTVEGLRLPAELGHGLTELSRRHGTTGFMTLLTAFQALLGRYTGQVDLAVGTAIANRTRAELEGLLGFFVNTLVLRGDLSRGPEHREATFGQLLARVRNVTLDAYAHQDLPFEMLVEDLAPERDLGYNPLFQVFFVLQNAPRVPPEGDKWGVARRLAPELEMGLEPVAADEAKFDLTLVMEEEEEGGIRGEVQYSTDLFDATTIRRLARHFRTLLAGMVADPDRRLSELPLLAAAERHALVCEWNHSPQRDPGAGCCHELFAARAATSPAAVAVVSRSGRLSYGELNARADRLAVCLRSLGVGPEVVVGIFLERSADALVGILGVLKAGGAYLPLDPAYPRDRLAFMLEDAGARVVLTRDRPDPELPSLRAAVVRLEAGGPVIPECHPKNPPLRGSPPFGPLRGSLAYVIYTSGSTGRPKGVMLSHRGLAALVAAQIRYYAIGPQSRVVQFSSLSFDASVYEIFSTLVGGGTLCLGTADELMPGPELSRFLRRHAVTTWTVVPSALQAMPAEELPALAFLTVAGEACPAELAARWAAGRFFVNAYGPTETTVCASAGRVRDSCRKPSIGRPFAASRLYVVDRHLELVPIGVPGELLIGGLGTARGYRGRPKLTAARFVPDPWDPSGGTRL